MGRFLTGLLMGVGVGLLVAPRRGQEMRHLVGENIGRVRGSLPENMQNVRFMSGRSSSGMVKDVEEYYQPELSKQGNRPLEAAGSTSSGARQPGSAPATPSQAGSPGMSDQMRSNTPDFLRDQGKPGGTSMSGTQRPLGADVNDSATRSTSSGASSMSRPGGNPSANDPRKPLNPDNRPSVPPDSDPGRSMPRPEKRDAGGSPPVP